MFLCIYLTACKALQHKPKLSSDSPFFIQSCSQTAWTSEMLWTPFNCLAQWSTYSSWHPSHTGWHDYILQRVHENSWGPNKKLAVISQCAAAVLISPPWHSFPNLFAPPVFLRLSRKNHQIPPSSLSSPRFNEMSGSCPRSVNNHPGKDVIINKPINQLLTELDGW